MAGAYRPACRQSPLRISYGARRLGSAFLPMEAQVLGFIAILSAGLCGYANTSIVCWPAAAIALTSVSWGRHYLLVQRGLEAGLDDVVAETLLKSVINALIETGGCYWAGSALRALSGL